MTISSGDLIEYDLSDMVDMLDNIYDDVSLIRDTVLDIPDTSLMAVSEPFGDSAIDGYFCFFGSEKVYFPSDRVQYLSRLPSGQLYNLSSSSFNCYAVNSSGQHIDTFRFPSFGSLQHYVSSGTSYYWQDVTHGDDNVVTGVVGLSSPVELILFCILFVLLCFIFVKRK